MSVQHLTIEPKNVQPPTRDFATNKSLPENLPDAKEIKVHPRSSGAEDASLYFVGTATVILEWAGIRIMTDPNFLHAGDHVHLGPGVSSARKTNPGVELHDLPSIDLVLLSHYHEDHFDRKVEASLRRDLPIITTPHAKEHLTSKGPGESFTNVYALDAFEQIVVEVQSTNITVEKPSFRVTGLPGKHVPTKPLQKLNDYLQAIPPTNGWMLELGYSGNRPSSESSSSPDNFDVGYRIYITGDTLMVDELKEIPKRYADSKIDLMLVHLGGTTVPSPSLLPMAVMVTMDAKQGLELIQLIKPDLTIPIHYDDYDVFASPLDDFKTEIERANLASQVVYLDRGDRYKFRVAN